MRIQGSWREAVKAERRCFHSADKPARNRLTLGLQTEKATTLRFNTVYIGREAQPGYVQHQDTRESLNLIERNQLSKREWNTGRSAKEPRNTDSTFVFWMSPGRCELKKKKNLEITRVCFKN